MRLVFCFFAIVVFFWGVGWMMGCWECREDCWMMRVVSVG
jgi:hypothetical protein